MATLWRSAHDKVPCMSTTTAPLKRLVITTDKNGNLGPEFVKCESKQEQGKGSSFRFQKLKQCAHFEWLDEYIERIQLEGASQELDLLLETEKFGSGPSRSGPLDLAIPLVLLWGMQQGQQS
ncbi:hypothetical protein D1007_53615 [Hordeum vulgare]|nr:hypothetical protein D1007_53615 [Hordeum vulgare]